MTEESYHKKRELLIYSKKLAELAHCHLVAAARQRDIDKLDKEYNKGNSKNGLNRNTE